MRRVVGQREFVGYGVKEPVPAPLEGISRHARKIPDVLRQSVGEMPLQEANSGSS